MAPPLFSLDTLSNSQSVIFTLSINLTPIAPAVLFAYRFLNFVLEIIIFELISANTAAAYFVVVFKKFEFVIVAFDSMK